MDISEKTSDHSRQLLLIMLKVRNLLAHGLAKYGLGVSPATMK